MSAEEVNGFEEELDWSKCFPKHVYNRAE